VKNLHYPQNPVTGEQAPQACAIAFNNSQEFLSRRENVRRFMGLAAAGAGALITEHWRQIYLVSS